MSGNDGDLVFAAAPLAPAQSPPNRPAADVPTQTPPGTPRNLYFPTDGPVISLDFPGGTVTQFAAAIKKAAGESPVNIIIPNSIASIAVPAISLKSVSVGTALATMAYAQGGDDEVADRLRSELLPDPNPGSFTFAIRSTHNPRVQSARPIGDEPRSTRVHSLRNLVEPPDGLENDPSTHISIDTLMGAITATVEADSPAGAAVPPPELSLHCDSFTLICRGTEEQQNLVKSVIGTIESGIRDRRNELRSRVERSRQSRLESVTRDAEMRQATIQFERCRAEVEAASMRLDKLKRDLGSNAAYTTEVENTSAALASARSNMEQAKNQLDMLKSRAAVINATEESARADQSFPTAAPDNQLVIYNIQDLPGFADQVADLAKLTLRGQPGNKVQLLNGSLIVTANPSGHEAIRRMLLTLIRVKANDPKFEYPEQNAYPGLTEKLNGKAPAPTPGAPARK